MRPTEAALVVSLMCACGSRPSVLSNRSEFTSGCPPAWAVLGPAQSATETTWTIPLARDRLPAGRIWLLRETTPPCEVRVATMAEVCELDEPCDVGYNVTLAARCAEPGIASSSVSMADDDHPLVVEGVDPSTCKLGRPVVLQGEDVEGVVVPEPVQHALGAARARRSGTVILSTTRAGAIDALWEVSTFDYDAPTDGVGNSPVNCPRETWVFVRGPEGIVQLDSPEGISGLLFDAHGPRVVLTGRYGLLDNVSFDVARLPPHRPGAGSHSSLGCNR